MNWSFFTSWYGVAGVAFVGGFVAWWLKADVPLGRAPDQNVAFLLWTGWVALALYVAVVLYTARKYLHRFAGSPEFRLRMPAENVERAERAIMQIQQEVRAGTLEKKKEIIQKANAVLRREGAQRVMRPQLSGAPGSLVVDVVPTDPAGRVATWMSMHLYLGVAAGVLVWLHGGGSFSSPMAALLNGLSLLVIGTGVIGIVLWGLGPRWLTRREKDLSIEEAFVLDRSLTRKLREQMQDLEPPLKKDLEKLYGRIATRAQVDAVLAPHVAAEPDSEPQLRDLATLAGQRECIRRDMRGLKRIKSLMNLWRIVHVPLSLLLFALLVVHVASIWWY